MTKSTIAYLLTGSNLGDRSAYLKAAIDLIEQRAGRVLAASNIYQTAAWGVEDQPDYYNQALAVETSLSPELLLQTLLDIENELGRERIEKWGARTIDIDILLYGNLVVERSNLTIPHRFLHKRNFTLIPLMEIAGEIIHPVFKKTVEELYWASEDPLEVYVAEVEETHDSNS